MTEGESTSRILAERLFRTALRSADPYLAVQGHMDRVRAVAGSAGCGRIVVIGFGKAACRMAQGAEDALGDLVDTGLVITCHGCGRGFASVKTGVVEAGHPIPDADGVRGTEELMQLVRPLAADTLVLSLISGGGSALLVTPVEGVTLEEKQLATRLLLESGADISELNCVRKHLSQVKGGRLAELIHPARCVSLILSDVVGDRLDVIASGPTAPDETNFADALAVIHRRRLENRVPAPVMEHLQRGAKGQVAETLKKNHPVFHSVENFIIGSNRLALDAAARAAAAEGLAAEIVTAELSGEARDGGRWLAQRALAAQAAGAHNVCLLSGGETTVSVTGRGTGGRNQELALSFALEVAGAQGITLLSAGTDGIDGPTDAAGAVVDGKTVPCAVAAGIDPASYLTNNDSHKFFQRCGGLVMTGPTGTNVMDLQIVLIDSPATP